MIISNRNKFTIAALFSIAFLLPGCRHSNPGDLKEKYSAEAINYFYETVFFEDYVGRRENYNKWNKDLYYYVAGDFLANDVNNIQTAITELNSLQLPVSLYLTSDSLSANVFVHYGSYPYLEEKLGLKNRNYVPFVGVATSVIGKSSYKERGIVGLANDAGVYKRVGRQDSIKIRYSTVLEEFTQSLGVGGDSWHYPHSLFFEGGGLLSGLSAIDKEVIKFLYEPSIPAQYSRQQFEKDFGDVLYHINAPPKIADYLSSNNIPPRFLEYIRNHSFQDSLFVKWPSEIYLSLRGDFSQEDSLFWNNAVDLFNSISNQLQLIIGAKSPNNFPSISICYKCGTREDHIISESETTVGWMMFPRRVQSEIRTTGRKLDPQELNKYAFDSLYEALGFDYNDPDNNIPDNNIMTYDSLGNILLNADYKEMLALIYEPIFYSGLTLKEFDRSLELFKNKGYNNE